MLNLGQYEEAMLIRGVRFWITDVMKALLEKGFNFRLDNLRELLRITKYNHGWPPNLMGGCSVVLGVMGISPSGVLKTKKPGSMITSRLYVVRRYCGIVT
jgi:hypothetical protein